MIKVSLLIHENVYSSSVAGVIDLFTGANWYFEQAGKPPAFKLELVSEKVKNIQLDVPAQFICYVTMEEVTQTDLIIVPGFRGENRSILKKNKAITSWIKKMHQSGTEVASLCVGSFFLAEAGLLDDKIATSHWAAADEMQQLYPFVKVKSDMVITDQGGIYTSGGAFSSIKLVLYLIEKFCGRAAALWISKRFSVDIDQISQAHFAVFTGQHQHKDNEILKSQLYIEQHYSADIGIGEVSAQCNTGKRNFVRRFKAATNNTPIEYLQRVRVEAAKKALEDKDWPLDEVMGAAGYKDMKTFRMIFKRITGLSPRDYRKKYSRVVNSIEESGKCFD
ncbi:Transcriptional regulator GlxA family, contains an amidase domain and an AraC-type DNA-binding HTH domain [Chryseolinea serpens]|uniref:Transcriptional regulator GlxA family, contains an amidase domain and an AraC-type DNA-binding HTH domain n=1 Tax=Chryseolinea serpens TaxID=947013 RepID=A0A1M5M7N2_9BACT|nr:helix-turn-helix domain-containing protein [Chryseolinea serpens]SHG73270.1 Transcriptional regulator GlxA family, contains an amidase domain and an AraC-type DNA-binding HTH domain [Chryseolinea serpens]